MKTVLVADDERGIRELIFKYLTHENYRCLLAETGKQALTIFLQEEVDLVIMDIMMPEMDGYRSYQKMRENREVPCIFLSALGQEEDKLYGFDLGANDYMVKPFSPKELIRRVRVALRTVVSEETKVFALKGLCIDFASLVVTVDGQRVSLSLKEFRLLENLVKHRGITRNREDLLREVWGEDSLSEDRTLDTHIKLLRKAIQPYDSLISTVRGVGYRFEKED